MSTDLSNRRMDDVPTAPRPSRRRWWLVGGAILLVPVLAVGWWLLRPALVDDVVDTAFPASIDASGVVGVVDPGDDNVAADETRVVGDPMDGQFVIDEADDDQTADSEQTPVTSGQAAGAAGTSADQPAEASDNASASSAVVPTADPAEEPVTQESGVEEELAPAPPVAGPTLVSSGQFVGLDNHDASGRAAIFELEDGTHVIRLEDLDADNGPELQLHLVPGRDQTRPSEGSFIAPLQGNKGNQTYELPSGFEIPVESTILIWCAPFNVAVGGATQNGAS